jgi:hypothetical protein
MPLYKRAAPAGDIPRMDWYSTTALWSVWDYAVQARAEFPDWTAVVDFANVRTMWRKFNGSGPPEIVWDKTPGQAGPAPSNDKEWRYGIAVVVYAAELDGLREIRTTAAGLCEQLSDRYDEWEKNPQGKPAGQLALIQTRAPKSYTNPHGTFFNPTLETLDYVPRPPELPEAPAVRANPVAGKRIAGLDDDLNDDVPF